MKQKVLITRQIPAAGIRLLQKHLDVTVHMDEAPMARDEIIRAIHDKQGLVCLLTDRIDAAVMDAAPGLRVIANYAVGYDNIDVESATRRKICVTNTPGVLTEATADLTWALIFAVSRRIVEADRYVRAGSFRGWEPLLMLGDDIHGKTLGIIGLGRIGQAVARRAQGLEMKVLYHEPQRLSGDIERACQAEYRSLPSLLRDSDLVTLHVPFNRTTHHLVGSRELNSMKKEAYLINVSRGPVIDEKALVRALKNGDIAGCGLDVYEREPSIEQDLLSMENTVLLPHIGSASRSARIAMAQMTAQNVIAVLVNRTRPPYIVNSSVFT